MAEAYLVNKDYTGILQKKNAVGMWAKKHVLLNGVNLSVADSEGGAAIAQCELANITRGGEAGDANIIQFIGAPENLFLKAENREQSNYWYELVYKALEVAGRIKPRLGGLPPRDPRHGLKFLEIPAEYGSRFQSIERSVMYWFSPIKKYGTKNRLTGNHATEDRIGFLSDKCFYVTKPNSEVTRCMKLSMLTAVFTNSDVKGEKDEAFIVLKMKHPDYDLYFSAPTCGELAKALGTLYHYLSQGRNVPITQVKKSDDPAVQLQLSRPQEYQPIVLLPVQWEELKVALDKYAKAHGITFSTTGSGKADSGAKKKSEGSASPNHADPNSAATSPGGARKAEDGTTAPAPGAAKPQTVLYRFLSGCGLADELHDKLAKQTVDLEVLEVMDDDDMASFGITNKQHAARIREKLGDVDFMAKVNSKTQAMPEASETAASSSSTAQAPAAQATSPPAAKPGAVAIDLDDDDDDFGVLPSSTATKKAPIMLDDDFDDFDIPAKPASSAATAASGIKINLDSDDDLDLPAAKPAAKPAAAKPTIDLSDDDI